MMELVECVETGRLLEGEETPPAAPSSPRRMAKKLGGLVVVCGVLLLFAAAHRRPNLAAASRDLSQVQMLAAKQGPTTNRTAELSKTCMCQKYALCKAPWAFCTDAKCEAPVGGIAKCSCWKQAAGVSILPQGGCGAGCMAETGAGGEAMCKEMQNGKIYSTFSPRNTSYYPPRAFIECPPKTPFAYCWGASCLQDPDDEHKAICDCPMFISPSAKNQVVTIEAEACDSKAETDMCQERTLNSIPFPNGPKKVPCLSFA